MMQSQTEKSFREVLEPKVQATVNLDQLTRELCSHSLHQFVAFSSLLAGRGNTGQSNYSYANSAMEKICLKRQNDGFPGKISNTRYQPILQKF